MAERLLLLEAAAGLGSRPMPSKAQSNRAHS